jgi:hypothetical protein
MTSRLGGEEHNLSEIDKRCDFSTLDNQKASFEHGENGLYCGKQSYTYSLGNVGSQELNAIYTKDFTVVGAQKEAVTYLFDLTIGFDFATGAQLKAVLSRNDQANNGEFRYDPLKCLYDHSCIETEQVGKNEVGISAILTGGEYTLTIFDQQDAQVRRWLQSTGLSNVPFSFDLQATPVVQNEERVMCADKLYLGEDFIQNRFITDKSG